MRKKDYTLLSRFLILTCLSGCLVGAATLDGCYKVDKTNRVFTISPGGYDPETFDHDACTQACAYRDYSFAALHAGKFCLCSDVNHAGAAKQPDETQCNSTCTGDSTQNCGHDDYDLVYQLTGTPAAIQLGPSTVFVLGSSAAVTTDSVSGTDLTFSYDFGDGTAPSEDASHQYNTPGDYVLSVVVNNDNYVDFDASHVHVSGPAVSGVTLTCPEAAGVSQEFKCTVEILHGNDLQVSSTFDTGLGAVAAPTVSAGEPTYFFAGYVTQDPNANTLASDDIHIYGDPVYWVFPGAETLTPSKLIAIEAFIASAGDGSLRFLVYKPVCQMPSNVYCPGNNLCVDSLDCDYDFTTPTHPTQHDVCTATDIFCLSGSRCFDNADVHTCPASQARYETDPLGVPRAEYRVVQEIPLTGVSTGYLYHELATPIDVGVGDVLGVRMSAAGAKVAYEPAPPGSPAEFQYAGSEYAVDQAVPVASKNAGYQIRHHVRGAHVVPATVVIEHAFDATGLYDVTTTVSGQTGPDVQDRTQIRIEEMVTGPTVELETDVLSVGETVTAYARVTGGAFVNYTWNWGDGNEDYTIREATNFSEPDILTHTYTTDGTFTITLLALNFINNETATTLVYVQHPINPNHYVITSNSPQSHPGSISITVTLLLPAGQLLGTAAVVAISTTFYENTTSLDLNLNSDGQSDSFPHAVRFPGEYEVVVTISNKISSETFTLTIIMVEPITGFTISAMYQPPVPGDGPLMPGHGPTNIIFPLDTPVVFVPRLLTGTRVSYDIDYGDGSAVDTVTGDQIPYAYSTGGPYAITITASNDLFGFTMVDSINIQVQENIAGIRIVDLGGTTANEAKDFDIIIISLGTSSCLLVDYGDSAQEIFGNQLDCDNHAMYPTATWVRVLASPLRATHTYTSLGSFQIQALGFNLVSDASAHYFFAVSDTSCNSPQLSIRDGHPDWRGPRPAYFNQYLQLQGVTEVACPSSRNSKVWEMEMFDASTGLPIPGTKTTLTGLPPGHRFYLPDADTAEITIPPLILPIGNWKFTYTVHMEIVGVDIHASAVEYTEIRASALKIQIFEGQTTSRVVGHKSTVLLKPGLLSRDPDLPADVTDQNFNSIEYYCRRFYEPWKLDDDQEISKLPKIAVGVPNMDGVDDGGCFGTGNGLLDYSGDVLALDTTYAVVNMTYEVMVIVTKGSRIGNATVAFTVKDGTLPQSAIGCGGGTLYQAAFASVAVNPTDDFRLQASCEAECDGAVYRWEMEYVHENGSTLPVPNWEQYATGTSTNSLYLSKDVFSALPNIHNFVFTSHVTNALGESGKAHMRIVLNEPPEGGSCTIAPAEAMSNETVSIVCADWEDDQGISSYEFFVEAEEKSSNKIVGFGSQASAKFFPPVGKLEDDYRVSFGVQIDDVLGASTLAAVGTIKVKPSVSSLDYLSAENTAAIEHHLDTLAAEGNSRALNNVILAESSRLNDLRAVADRALNGSVSETTTQLPTTVNWDDSRVYEGERTKRAYWRTHMADLQTQASLDSLADVLQCATTATVLTAATDELSHDALSSMATLANNMVARAESMYDTADQKTVVKVSEAILECLFNTLQGSAETINNPLWMLDECESSGTKCLYSELRPSIELEKTYTEDVSQLTTSNSVFKQEKDQKAKSIVSQANLMIGRIVDMLKKNKLPGEPPSSVQTQSGSLTVSRTAAADAVRAAMPEGSVGGQFNMPGWCDLYPSTGGNCNLDEVVDVETNSFMTNHYNYMESSERISEKSHIMGMRFEDSSGNEIPITDTRTEIEVWIARPNTEKPLCNTYEQNFNSTSQSGMSLHTFVVQFDQTAVTVEVLPDRFLSTQYGLLVRYMHPPKLDEYDQVFILPYNISSGESSKDYSVYLSDSYIRNNTGKYYLGIVEIPQAPQGELPNNLFNDNLSPQQLLQDLLNKDTAFNFTSNYTLCIHISGCAFFNNESQEWSTEGVRIGPNTTKDLTQCFTRHLTDFASAWIIPPTPLDFDYIFANADFLKNLSIYITTIVVYVIFFFIFIWARRKDRKDIILQGLTPMADNNPKHKYLYELAIMTGQWKGSGTESKVSFILSGEDDETEVRAFKDSQRPILQTGSIDRFVMAVPRPLGALNYLRLWHDSSGKGAMQNWFVQYIAVRDLQTRQRYYFMANKWFSLVDDDGQVDRLLPVTSRDQMKGFNHVFSSHTRKNLNDGHLWFSIFLRPTGSHFTRVQRAACCMMALWLEMLVNIMWYKVSPPSPSSGALKIGPLSMSPAQISIGVMSSLIVFPITLLVVQIFRKARPRLKQKSHRRVIKDQQEELKKKYRVGNDDVVSESHVIMESRTANDDTLSTRSQANLLDNQAGQDGPALTVKTTASQPAQAPKRRRKKLTLPWWTIIMAWFLCLLTIAAATLFTVFYGIQFGDETTREWLASLVVTFVTGILCTQPIKIILVALFVALIFKSPNADEEEGEEIEEDPELGKDEMWLHDLSSPADGKTAYKPLDAGNLERMREQRVKELKMYNILREICFYVIFLWTLMVFSYSNIDRYSFYMKDQYTSILGGREGANTFDKIVGVKHFWRWMDSTLVPNLYAGSWYNGQVDDSQAGYFSDRQSYILGKVVLRQVRINPGLCEVHKEFVGIIPECNEDYGIFDQDTGSYGRAWRPVNDSADADESYSYVMAEVLDGYPFLGKHALYSGGGYVVVLEGTPWGMRQTLKRLYNETWIDKYTRAVFIEFSTYNPQVNLFAVVNFITEFLPTGAGQTTKRVDVIRLLTYSEGFGLVRIMCEVMFFCFIAFFIVKEFRNARRERRQYLKNFWNLTECAIIGFSVSSAIIYFYRLYVTDGLIELLKSGGYHYIKLQYVAYWNEILGYMLGWIMFLATLKFLKLLRFNRRIGVLSSTISNCTVELLNFSIMFTVVFIAFATAFYLIFSSNVFNYSDFIYTCESLLSAILGKFKFEELIIAERVLGPVFFFLFMGSTTYILINMFLTIINESFKVVNSDLSKQSNEYEMVDFMITRLKLWTGIGKPPVGGANPAPGNAGNKDDCFREPDLMDEFPEKVDQLLNSIAKIYFNHNSFNEVIRGRGQNGKKGKASKKTISV